jgi:hypothetical protein
LALFVTVSTLACVGVTEDDVTGALVEPLTIEARAWVVVAEMTVGAVLGCGAALFVAVTGANVAMVLVEISVSKFDVWGSTVPVTVIEVAVAVVVVLVAVPITVVKVAVVVVV